MGARAHGPKVLTKLISGKQRDWRNSTYQSLLVTPMRSRNVMWCSSDRTLSRRRMRLLKCAALLLPSVFADHSLVKIGPLDLRWSVNLEGSCRTRMR